MTLVSSVSRDSLALYGFDSIHLGLLLRKGNPAKIVDQIPSTIESSSTYVGPMLTPTLSFVNVRMTHIISVLKMHVKTGSPSSHGETLRTYQIG